MIFNLCKTRELSHFVFEILMLLLPIYLKISLGESFINISQLVPCGEKKDNENSCPEAKMF